MVCIDLFFVIFAVFCILIESNNTIKFDMFNMSGLLWLLLGVFGDWKYRRAVGAEEEGIAVSFRTRLFYTVCKF